MTRQDAIDRGLIAAAENDYARNECLRKVPYVVIVDAFTEALRLAARKEQDGQRLKVYCCRFCSKLHIGNYSPSKRTLQGQFVFLQGEHKKLLGQLSRVTNELAQCRKARDSAKSELGQMRAALGKRSLWRRLLSYLWNRSAP